MKSSLVWFVLADQLGEIQASGHCDATAIGSSSAGLVCLAGPDGANDATAWVRDGAVVWYTAEQRAAKGRPPAFPCRWDNRLMQWIDVRNERQRVSDADRVGKARRASLLAASDWTQGRDSPLDEAQIAAWASYRQALRDLPGLPGWPGDVSWPEPPAHAG